MDNNWFIIVKNPYKDFTHEERMKINDWCRSQFGAEGNKWQYYRSFTLEGWAFKDKKDAMFFKLNNTNDKFNSIT